MIPWWLTTLMTTPFCAFSLCLTSNHSALVQTPPTVSRVNAHYCTTAPCTSSILQARARHKQLKKITVTLGSQQHRRWQAANKFTADEDYQELRGTVSSFIRSPLLPCESNNHSTLSWPACTLWRAAAVSICSLMLAQSCNRFGLSKLSLLPGVWLVWYSNTAAQWNFRELVFHFWNMFFSLRKSCVLSTTAL